MSGIVGIVNLNSTPVDERLLRRMTASLAYRGPDAQQTWAHGSVGFGHTLLNTTESQHERQPASLDGEVWITADARVDGRDDLVEQLASQGRRGLEGATDCQLILHAYHVWGEDFVDHLLGDFALAIWDGRTRRLFCARDHFGIKPLYFARIRDGVVFSNTLDCVRLHPEVGDGLDELAIGDFLLFGYNLEPTTTTFADIRRVPPAHSVTFGNGIAQSKRYWSLPTDGMIRYGHAEEYIERFRELLRAAVSDRLRTNDIGVWMSGGLDSTSITAIAQQLRLERAVPSTLRAHTIFYESLIPDRERDYAGIAAEALGVDVNFFAADDYRPFDGWDREDLRTPEPIDDLFLLMRRDQLRASRDSQSRLALRRRRRRGSVEVPPGRSIGQITAGGIDCRHRTDARASPTPSRHRSPIEGQKPPKKLECSSVSRVDGALLHRSIESPREMGGLAFTSTCERSPVAG